MNELDDSQLWRVSFDNLNFKMKYSKDIFGDSGPKRTLNLITGQVAHTNKPSGTHACICKVLSLKKLSQNALKKLAHPQRIQKELV